MTLQREITDFLGDSVLSSPAVNQQPDIDQSQVTEGSVSPAPKARNSHASKDPPQRTKLKRKRVAKEIRRRERKRINQPRKCKVTRHQDSTPQKTSETPMPSPNGSPNLLGPGNTDSHTPIPLNDRSLTDMLASAAAASPVNSNEDNQNGDNISSTRIERLESELNAAALALRNETTEKTRYKCALELLQHEIDEGKCVQKNLKSEIKRLTNENDNLRREVSRYRGMRRFATEPEGNKDNTSNSSQFDELAIAQAQLTSLREHIISVGKSLITAADGSAAVSPDDNEFVQVTNRRKRKSRETFSNAQPNEGNIQSHSKGQPIPVVIGSKGIQQTASTSQYQYAEVCRRNMSSANEHDTPSSYSPCPPDRPGQHHPEVPRLNSRVCGQPVTAPQQPAHRTPAGRNSYDTMIIGTSLTRGLGSKLRQTGVNCSNYSYPGCDIPHIRSRIRHIISPHNQPAHILLQCGGNDAEYVAASHVIHEYESLINEVRKCSPNATITLCAIPPRRDNAVVLNAIDAINGWMKRRASSGDNVYFIKTCPNLLTSFKRDMVHFNAKGLHFYARRIATYLVNFYRPSRYEGM